jgi:hypothetical protein
VAVLVGEVGALLISRSDVGEVEAVGLSAAAHRHIGPFPVGGPVDDHEGTVGGDPLGLVTGEGVAVVDVALVEVPDGQVAGFGVTVKLNGEALPFLINIHNSGEVAVEYPDPGLVLAEEDPVTRLEHPLTGVSMVGPVRIELTTLGLKVPCSAN